MSPFFLSASLLMKAALCAPDQPFCDATLPSLGRSQSLAAFATTEVARPTAEPIAREMTVSSADVSAPPVPQSTPETPAEHADSAAGSAEEIVVSGRRRSSSDPIERVNVQSYKAIQAVDRAFVGPLAKGYKSGVPKPVRNGIHNFLNNVQEPIVFLNYLLQLKPGKAAETLGRFAINTTAGIAGVVDVARKKPFELPHRPNSLANTLGYYGVGPGPYLFLPLIGPTTLRDLVGISVDRLVLPVAVGGPFNRPYYALPTNALSTLEYRVAADEKLTELRNAEDPYAATRRDYLEKRKHEIDRLHSPAWQARRISARSLQLIDTSASGSPIALPVADAAVEDHATTAPPNSAQFSRSIQP